MFWTSGVCLVTAWVLVLGAVAIDASLRWWPQVVGMSGGTLWFATVAFAPDRSYAKWLYVLAIVAELAAIAGYVAMWR